MNFLLDNTFICTTTGKEIHFTYPIDAEEGLAEGWVVIKDKEEVEPAPTPAPTPEPSPEPEATPPEEEPKVDPEEEPADDESVKPSGGRRSPRRRASM